jgi:hypothetical protein
MVVFVTAAALVFAIVAAWTPLAHADGPDTAPPSDQSSNPPLQQSGPDQPPPDPGASNSPSDSGGTPLEPPAPTPPEMPPSVPPLQSELNPPADPAPPADPPSGSSIPNDTSADTGSSKKAPTTRDSASAAPVAASTPTATYTAPQEAVPPEAGGPADQMWVEQWDSFKADSGGAVTIPPSVHFVGRGRFLFLGTGGRKVQLEGQARQNGQRPKISALGAGLAALPGLPGRALGSFFDLFAGGGGGATLMFFGLLCVLGTMLVPTPRGTRFFRLPAVTWRPSEYVPPIEQPG